ncbi:MAG: SGNH/GDSL hydrolase family protein, partial [Candidatus Woesearchaeota archaeon]|nr:SGNH/GDSL hydrolase family protein [Candidatus Woesearchaeota archaeon]
MAEYETNQLNNSIFMPQIMVFGTSTEWGAWDEKGGWVDRLKQHCNQLHLKDPEKYYVVYNLGVSGDTSRELSVRIREEFRARKDPAEKNIIILSVGGNDAAYFSKKNKCLVPLEE